MDNKLLNLLRLESKEISEGFKKSSLEGAGTPQEVADRREEIFKEFIGKYFPFPYRIAKGNITDAYDRNSQSIDCIVLNPSHPYTIDTKNKKASIILADGVDFAIEIKPDLNSKKEIHRALEQIQSVKKLRRIREQLLIKNQVSEKKYEYAKTIPCIIVSEKTYVNENHLLNIIVDFYIENSVPPIEQFDIILVNGRFVAYNFRKNSFISNGDSEGIMLWDGEDDSLALLLFELNRLPQSMPLISSNVLELYLKRMFPMELKYDKELNDRLLSIKDTI
jgi:hypothetical protein